MTPKIWNKTPEILEATDGKIIRVKRHRDNQELFIGQDTKSGGKIVSFTVDINWTANMYVKMDQSTAHTSVSAIVIN